MINYVLKRIILIFPVLFVVLVVSFFLIHIASPDFAMIYWRMHAGNQSPTRAQLEKIRVEMGLNDPLIVQFFRWIGEVARLDLGKTLYTKQSVSEEFAARFPYTLSLTVAALIIVVLIALPLGILSASKPGSFWDGLSRVFASSGISIPQFWLGLLLLYFFSFKLHLLPMLGSGTILHLVLPAITLALGPAATLTRLTRANMLDIMTQDYVTTAFAKGLMKWKVLLKHVLRPALIPVLTMIGLQFGFIFGGAVVVESVFCWPGIGKWAIDGIFQRDMPILRAFILTMGCLFVFLNLLVDLLYIWIDPRIRYE